MSGRLMERVVDLLPGLPHATARVLFVLARYADDDGANCFPSLDTIAAFAEMPRSTVVRSIAQLAALGMVQQTTGGGRARANHYLLTLGQPARPNAGGFTPRFVDNPVDNHTVNPVDNYEKSRVTLRKEAVEDPKKSRMVREKSRVVLPDSIKTLRKEEKGDSRIDGKKEGSTPAPATPPAPPEPLADSAAVLAAVGGYLGQMRGRIAAAPGCRPQRTPDAQIAALTGNGGPPRYFRPGPPEPVRSVEEQLAILLGNSAPHQAAEALA